MNDTLPPTQARVFQIPELLEEIAAHLSSNSLSTCIRVCKSWSNIFIPVLWNTIDDSLFAWPAILRKIDSSQNTLNEAWLKNIFAKYGRHIRHLTIRWRILIDAAYLDKACTNLLSIRLRDIKQFHTINEKRDVRCMKYRTVTGKRRYVSERHHPALIGPIISSKLNGIFEPTAVLLKTAECQMKDWMTHQFFWMLLRQNTGLRLISLHGHLDLLSNLKSLEFIYDTFAMLPNLTTLENPYYPLEYNTLLTRVPSLRNYSWRSVPPLMPAVTFNPTGLIWNLESLTITESIPLIELYQVLRSIPDLSKLKLFCVHGRIDGTVLSSIKEDPKALFTQEFRLKSLTVDAGSKNVFQDPEIAGNILQQLPELKELCFIILHSDLATATAQFCPQLECARQSYDGASLAKFDFTNDSRRPQNELILNSQAPLFQSCRYLRIFDAIQHSFDAEHISESVWVCEGLEVFRCQIVGLSRLDQNEHSIMSYITESGLLEAECSTKEQSVLAKARTCKRLHEAVYDQLARFTKLKILDLGYEYRSTWSYITRYTTAGNEYRDYGGLIKDTLQLSLASGLDRLATLENLQVFGFEGVDHEMDLFELEWIAIHWPRLRIMRGLHKDRPYVKPDRFRQTLRRTMQSLRPDIRHKRV
ncbi:hypothetical protein EC991_006353 [Linnemannia zychae]|nr:hypothetical protein EC991_006353 [Linnemannia zychae]